MLGLGLGIDNFANGMAVSTSAFRSQHSFLLDGISKCFGGIDRVKINPYVTGSNKQFTIFWSVKRVDVSSAKIPFGNFDGTTWSLLIQFTSGKISLFQKDSGISKVIESNSSYTSTTEWYNFAFVIDGVTPANSKILLNDVDVTVVNTLTSNVDAVSASNYQYGCSGNNAFPYNGYHGAISLVEGARNTSETSDWYNGGQPKNPQDLFGSDCRMFLNPDNSGDTAQFTITDSVNGITATSANLLDADKTTETPY